MRNIKIIIPVLFFANFLQAQIPEYVTYKLLAVKYEDKKEQTVTETYDAYKSITDNFWSPGNKQSEKNGKIENINEISIMSFNAYYSADVESTITTISETGADIVGLQEASASCIKSVGETGMEDAYRVAHPDEVAKNGITWTTHHSENEVYDRIDFVCHAMPSKWKLKSVKRVGGPDNDGSVKISDYKSDHYAVIAAYTLPNN